ncbi:hypothetical protein SUGI_0730140 [Cryptomeria japonica]|nr:hypothetical protein SUGI_0730140 [Cryptomeria japonica]
MVVAVDIIDDERGTYEPCDDGMLNSVEEFYQREIFLSIDEASGISKMAEQQGMNHYPNKRILCEYIRKRAKEEIKEQAAKESLMIAEEKSELEPQEVAKSKEEKELRLCIEDVFIIADNVQETFTQFSGVIEPCNNDLQCTEMVGPCIVKNDSSKIDL